MSLKQTDWGIRHNRSYEDPSPGLGTTFDLGRNHGRWSVFTILSQETEAIPLSTFSFRCQQCVVVYYGSASNHVGAITICKVNTVSVMRSCIPSWLLMQHELATTPVFLRELFLLPYVVLYRADFTRNKCNKEVSGAGRQWGYNSSWSQGWGYWNWGNWPGKRLPSDYALCRHRVLCVVISGQQYIRKM